MQQKIDFNFNKLFIVPNDPLLKKHDVDGTCALVWAAMANAYNFFLTLEEGYYRTSIGSLAAHCGLGEGQVAACLSLLEKKRLIEKGSNGAYIVYDYREVLN